MSAQTPKRYFLSQLEVDVLDDGDGNTTVFRSLSREEVARIKDYGDAPFKRFIKREKITIKKSDIAKYPSIVDVEVLIDTDDFTEKSLFDEEWFEQLMLSKVED